MTVDKLLDNLACASQEPRLDQGGDLRELVRLNVIEPMETADFYRRMRFCHHLFPNEDGNAHAQKNWGDILEAFYGLYESDRDD